MEVSRHEDIAKPQHVPKQQDAAKREAAERAAPAAESASENLEGSTSAPPRPGREHGRDKLWSVYWLAAAAAAVALTGMVPGVLDIVDHFRFIDESRGISRWAFLALLLGVVQLAYAVYVAQLADWSSVWVLALASLGLAAAYAMILALILMSSADNGIIQWLHLNLASRPKAARWCFMMLSLTSLLAYFAGRFSVRWHHLERTYGAGTGESAGNRSSIGSA